MSCIVLYVQYKCVCGNSICIAPMYIRGLPCIATVRPFLACHDSVCIYYCACAAIHDIEFHLHYTLSQHSKAQKHKDNYTKVIMCNVNRIKDIKSARLSVSSAWFIFAALLVLLPPSAPSPGWASCAARRWWPSWRQSGKRGI